MSQSLAGHFRFVGWTSGCSSHDPERCVTAYEELIRKLAESGQSVVDRSAQSLKMSI